MLRKSVQENLIRIPGKTSEQSHVCIHDYPNGRSACSGGWKKERKKIHVITMHRSKQDKFSCTTHTHHAEIAGSRKYRHCL